VLVSQQATSVNDVVIAINRRLSVVNEATEYNNRLVATQTSAP
jgi:hypothetical protein